MVDHSDYTRVSIFFNFIKLLHYLNVAILKTNLLAGDGHVIDIFSSEDMKNMSPYRFDLFTID